MAVKVEQKPEIESEEEDIFANMSPTNTEEIEKEVAKKLPPFPAKTIRADRANVFWEWVDQVDENEFDHLVPYLYRTWPIIDRQRLDSKAALNIDKLGDKRTLSLEYIKQTHGNGSYKITVNDVNKAVNGKGGTIGSVYLDIKEPGLDPILRLDELDFGHRENKVYVDKLIAQGKITPEGKVNNMTPQANTGNDPALMTLVTNLVNQISKGAVAPAKDATAETIGQMYSKASEQMMQMVRENSKSENDPLKMLSALKDLLPKQDSGEGMLALVLKLQNDSQARENQTMMKLMELMQNKPNEADAEDKVLDRMAKYKELFGGGEGGAPAKRSTIEILAEAGAPILGKVFDTVQLILQGQMMAKAGMNPQSAPQAQQPIAQQVPQIPKGDNVVEMPQPEQDQFTQLLTQYGGMIVQAINTKTPGDKFAESIDTMFGTIVYESIAGMGKDGILAKLQAVPNVWNQIGGAPQLVNQFIDEFIEYGQGEGEEGE